MPALPSPKAPESEGLEVCSPFGSPRRPRPAVPGALDGFRCRSPRPSFSCMDSASFFWGSVSLRKRPAAFAARPGRALRRAPRELRRDLGLASAPTRFDPSPRRPSRPWRFLPPPAPSAPGIASWALPASWRRSVHGSPATARARGFPALPACRSCGSVGAVKPGRRRGARPSRPSSVVRRHRGKAAAQPASSRGRRFSRDGARSRRHGSDRAARGDGGRASRARPPRHPPPGTPSPRGPPPRRVRLGVHRPGRPGRGEAPQPPGRQPRRVLDATRHRGPRGPRDDPFQPGDGRGAGLLRKRFRAVATRGRGARGPPPRPPFRVRSFRERPQRTPLAGCRMRYPSGAPGDRPDALAGRGALPESPPGESPRRGSRDRLVGNPPRLPSRVPGARSRRLSPANPDGCGPDGLSGWPRSRPPRLAVWFRAGPSCFWRWSFSS
jgi:hypothetical protein